MKTRFSINPPPLRGERIYDRQRAQNARGFVRRKAARRAAAAGGLFPMFLVRVFECFTPHAAQSPRG